MLVSDATSSDEVDPMPLTLICASHLHQLAEHFFDRGHDPGIRPIGRLQLDQVRHFLVDTHVRLTREALLQRIDHDLLAIIQALRIRGRVALLAEPAGLDELLGRWSGELDLRTGNWTDAYLAAFALAGECRLVAFDGDFRRYRGIQLLHLTPH